MTIKVYFRKHPTFWDDDVHVVSLSDFNLAATVDAKTLERAFRLTNTVEVYWPEQPGVVAEMPTNRRGWRSCSVGDLLERDRVFYIVSMVGFREVSVIKGEAQ